MHSASSLAQQVNVDCITTKRPENPIPVLKSTNVRWRFNFADFAAWYQPDKVNRRPTFVI